VTFLAVLLLEEEGNWYGVREVVGERGGYPRLKTGLL